MAAPGYLLTIERVAEMLGEDVDWLLDIALEMEPEDGFLTVFGTGEHYAFTDREVESLKQLIVIYKAAPDGPRPVSARRVTQRPSP